MGVQLQRPGAGWDEVSSAGDSDVSGSTAICESLQGEREGRLWDGTTVASCRVVERKGEGRRIRRVVGVASAMQVVGIWSGQNEDVDVCAHSRCIVCENAVVCCHVIVYHELVSYLLLYANVSSMYVIVSFRRSS